ncbi:MAG: SDR family NAD(P)-dependent oxidoreductase [Muribaculaceae bacterium]|nr:SDR family NAD(P)-dependent oxidoreductase [Muribaculaceae bacterium]
MMTDNDKVLDADVKPLYIVTGSTDSMGSVITRKLAEQGKAVLLASRDIQKAENFATQLRKVTRNKDISCLQLDLNSFELVNDFVALLRALKRPIAALINNAGLLPRRSEISPNGFEHAVQVNYLSTVLLSMQVYPLIEEGGSIILSTSVSRRFVTLPYEFPAVSHFTPLGAYAQSKLALTLFSIYMSSTMKTRRVAVNCVNPGLLKSGAIAMSRWMDRVPDYLSRNIPSPEAGVVPTMRALESNETGYLFSGTDRKVKTSTMLRNREMFIRLCNDTMRILKEHIDK